MQDTDILFSQPGSDVMPALFMPPGSTLVTPCRRLDRRWSYGISTGKSKPRKTFVEYGNEIRVWFNAMPDMRSIQLCGDEDIAFDQTEFMIPGTLNLQNLVKTMKIVIDDWKQRHAKDYS
eukprot:GSChrysophyteH1.ASY1.ANO1.1053.1 assembled CDS